MTKQWIIAIMVAVAYILISILTSGWKVTWLIWVGYAIYRLVEGKVVNRT